MSTPTSVFSPRHRFATCLGCMNAVSSPTVHHLVSAFILFFLGQRFPSVAWVPSSQETFLRDYVRASIQQVSLFLVHSRWCLLLALLPPGHTLVFPHSGPIVVSASTLSSPRHGSTLLSVILWSQHVELPFPCSGAAPPTHSCICCRSVFMLPYGAT